MTKILITDGMASDAVTKLREIKNFEIDLRKSTDAAELVSIIENYQCLIVRSATKVTADVIERARSLKLICRAGAGVDNVDVQSASTRKISVMNTASANSLAAAEHTIALLFAMFRQIPQAQASLKASRWDRSLFSGFEVTGKTLGILGLGNIGKLVAERARGLKMQVVGFDPFVKSLDGVRVENSLDSVLKQSDVITIHLPSNKDTKNLLSHEKLSLMKTGSWLINCARGGLIDEDAVCDLLDKEHLRGAAFDVFHEEPVNFPNRLVSHPKVVATPHLGASTAEAQLRVGLTAADQIIGFFERSERVGILN